jgi:hypothetical protein
VSTGKRVTIASVVTSALATAGLAFAGDGNKQQIRFNAADQSAARAVVLRKSDLGSASDWKGGARKPDLSAAPSCPNYNPKQSDLVLTGIAETQFSQGTIVFDSEVQVLATPRMVRLDWQRSGSSPTFARRVEPCVCSSTSRWSVAVASRSC